CPLKDGNNAVPYSCKNVFDSVPSSLPIPSKNTGNKVDYPAKYLFDAFPCVRKYAGQVFHHRRKCYLDSVPNGDKISRRYTPLRFYSLPRLHKCRFDVFPYFNNCVSKILICNPQRPNNGD